MALNKEYFGIEDWEYNSNGILAPVSTSTVNTISPIKDEKTEDTSFKLSYYNDTVTQITPVTNEVIKKEASIWTCLLYGQRIAYSAITGAKYTTSTVESTSSIVPAVDFTNFAVTAKIRVFNTETSFTDTNVIDYINSNPTAVKPASLSSSTGIGIVIETEDDTVVYPVSNNTRFYDYGRQISGGDAFSMWFQNRVPALGAYKFYNANPIFYLETTDNKRGALIPFDIPELGDTVRIGEDRYDPNNTPFGCLEKMYTNHFTWWECSSSFGAYVPQMSNTNVIIKFIKHSGLVFLDGNGDKWISFVGADGKATGELIRYDDPRAKDSLNYNSKSDGWNIGPGPGPEPGGEETDNMDIGLSLPFGGIARYYSMSSTEMSNLTIKLASDEVPEGYDPYLSIVEVKQFPFNIEGWFLSRSADTVKFRGWDTGVSCRTLGSSVSYIPFGEITVPEKCGNFLDYSPYSQYEIFIPFCGWVTVSDKVVGKSLTVDLLFDIGNATCIGVVRMVIDGNKTVIASKSGKLGRDILLTGDAVGMKSAATSMALMSVAEGTVSAGIGVSTGNVIGTTFGLTNMIAGMVQGSIAHNNNYTRSVGSTGDKCEFSMMKTCFLKISYPESMEPDNYGRAVGYVVNKWGRLGDYSGFTIMDNPHIEIDAYEDEKNELKELLQNGVIM